MTTETPLSKELRDAFTSPQAIAEMAAFERTSMFFQANYSQLLKQHTNQWIAVLEERVVAHADTLDAVLDQLDQAGIPRRSLVVRYMNPNPPVLHV